MDLLKGQRNGAEPYDDPGRAFYFAVFPHKFGWKMPRGGLTARSLGTLCHGLTRGPCSRFYINLCVEMSRGFAGPSWRAVGLGHVDEVNGAGR